MLTQNTHFSIGIHVLTALALAKGGLVPSQLLATSVNTNPAFLRAVMGRLKSAGLLQTKLGKGGGARLERDPSDITLLEIYRATEAQQGLCVHDCGDENPCPVAHGVAPFMDSLSSHLDGVVSKELAALTIADIVEKVPMPPGATIPAR